MDVFENEVAIKYMVSFPEDFPEAEPSVKVAMSRIRLPPLELPMTPPSEYPPGTQLEFYDMVDGMPEGYCKGTLKVNVFIVNIKMSFLLFTL